MNSVVFTNQARCRDCYRCVRVCPVKAIKLEHGQASVDADRCLACGTCIRECPQHAKTYRHDVALAKRLLAGPLPVAVSIAPSFVAFFTDWERQCLPSALRRLGFRVVAETANGAYPVARETAAFCLAEPRQSHLCTACPAVVSYVEKYRPELVSALVPVVSPMIAHSRQLRALPESPAKVVFIGPCVAKKAEAERPELAGSIDCVLTFAELRDWLAEAQIDLAACEPSAFDQAPVGEARTFPLAGGLLRTAELETDLLAVRTVAVSGIEELNEVLDALPGATSPLLVEPLFCRQGRINGPAAGMPANLFRRRDQVLDYATHHPGTPVAEAPVPPALAAHYAPAALAEEPVNEDRLRAILELTGKSSPADQLNCGACGYPTCRDQASAVLRGLAEPEMCIPYMRRLAERRTDRIIETSPNGIVILDHRLHILSVNPAFRKFFLCSEAICGKPVSYLMDPEPFERVATGQVERFEAVVHHDRYSLICHQIVYRLAEERQYVGILVNVTGARKSQEQLTRLRSQTVQKAQELLEHQVAMARQMAEFLGRSTAEGEALVEHLMQMGQEEQQPGDGKPREGNEGWKATYTST